MSIDIVNIIDRWKSEKENYFHLGEVVTTFLHEEVIEYEIFPTINFRVKDSISLIKKIKKKRRDNINYGYKEVNDKLGIRIICDFQEDMKKVDQLLCSKFCKKNIEYKQEGLDFNKLDYISNHYDLSIKIDSAYFKEFECFKNYIFEVQVRTLNQHAWSNTAHKLSYKRNESISSKTKRKIYRLLSLYEIADDEFSAASKLLQERTPDNLVYSLIAILEGKIYKYAKRNYDRELSVDYLTTILSFFSIEKKNRIYHEITSFINLNKEKIETIFSIDEYVFEKIPLLSQPEIFVIWFALDNFRFAISDEWANNFEIDELEEVANLWGESVIS